ncbi:carbohydrate ABC transporter permease [Blautia sp.]|uniref:carbohydrate ABC transporter permease n=1 Tax=Blautia sp. TaxID=1955243 RepID=UPI00258DC743|nr:carbohydrate ABC transporter permease [Blautia sp.]
MRKNQSMIRKIVIHIMLIFCSGLITFPFLWMLTNSVKTKDEIWQLPPKLFPAAAQWGNYKEVFADGMFFRYIWNSSYTAAICTIIVLINSAMFAYALTNIHFRGKKALFALVMSTYIMPSAATNVPSYIVLSNLGLMNTHTGYIISCIASIFNIFFFKTSFEQIDRSIINAAKVDGAGHWQLFWKIVVPMSSSSFVTLGLLSFIGNYNNYLWPSLILKDKDKYFVSMGLRAFFSSQGAYGMKWGAIMAACCVIIMPLLLLFLFCEKWILNGITNDAAIKG